MSVLNGVSSFSATEFFKDSPAPAMAFTAGLTLGGALLVIAGLGRTINNIDASDVQKGIAKRVEIVLMAWSVTSVLTLAGFFFRHPGFGILAVASSGVPFVVILNIKWEVQKNSSSFPRDTQEKLMKDVKHVFEFAILAIAALTFAFVSDYLSSKKLAVL